MKTTRSSILFSKVPGYAQLQEEMHDVLRAQHPEWIEADGNRPRVIITSRFSRPCSLAAERTRARITTTF
jgi:hypothetical protein